MIRRLFLWGVLISVACPTAFAFRVAGRGYHPALIFIRRADIQQRDISAPLRRIDPYKKVHASCITTLPTTSLATHPRRRRTIASMR